MIIYHRNKGYATQAVQGLIQYLFEKTNVEVLNAMALTNNEFFAKELNIEIEFVADENSDINCLNICQNGEKLSFRKEN